MVGVGRVYTSPYPWVYTPWVHPCPPGSQYWHRGHGKCVQWYRAGVGHGVRGVCCGCVVPACVGSCTRGLMTTLAPSTLAAPPCPTVFPLLVQRIIITVEYLELFVRDPRVHLEVHGGTPRERAIPDNTLSGRIPKELAPHIRSLQFCINCCTIMPRWCAVASRRRGRDIERLRISVTLF